MVSRSGAWKQFFRDAPNEPNDGQIGEWPREQLVRMDELFRMRLAHAIASGRESAAAVTATVGGGGRNA